MINQQRIPQSGKWRTSTQRWRRPRRPPWPWSPTTTVPETPLPFRSSSSQSPPPPPSSTATKMSDNTKIEIPEQKQKQKQIIYTSKKRSGPWLLRSLNFLGFRIFQNHEISHQRSTKNFSEREKESQGLKGLDRWRRWKNWLMINKFSAFMTEMPSNLEHNICAVVLERVGISGNMKGFFWE